MLKAGKQEVTKALLQSALSNTAVPPNKGAVPIRMHSYTSARPCTTCPFLCARDTVQLTAFPCSMPRRSMLPRTSKDMHHAGTRQQHRTSAAHRHQEAQHVSTNTAPTVMAHGAMDHALDNIGVGRFHMFLLFCVSLIWAGERSTAVVGHYLMLVQQLCCFWGEEILQQ